MPATAGWLLGFYAIVLCFPADIQQHIRVCHTDPHHTNSAFPRIPPTDRPAEGRHPDAPDLTLSLPGCLRILERRSSRGHHFETPAGPPKIVLGMELVGIDPTAS